MMEEYCYGEIIGWVLIFLVMYKLQFFNEILGAAIKYINSNMEFTVPFKGVGSQFLWKISIADRLMF